MKCFQILPSFLNEGQSNPEHANIEKHVLVAYFSLLEGSKMKGLAVMKTLKETIPLTQLRQSSNYLLGQLKLRHSLNICYFFTDLTVNGQILTPNEAGSSPSDVIRNKGSSVWLHWAYNYLGDGIGGGVTRTYKEQVIGFNSTSEPTIQPLAKRIGQNGVLTLESSIPAQFNGRVQVISANSTLVINNLQYNDSSYQFGSYVIVEVNSGVVNTNKYYLKPFVDITVSGMDISLKKFF